MNNEITNIIKQKIYGTLLFLLVMSIPFGYYFFPFSIGSVNLYFFRVIYVICLVFLILNKDIVFFSGKYSRWLFFFLAVWIIYAALGYFYAFNKDAVVKETLLLIFGLSLIVIFNSFFKKLKDPLSVFMYGWIAGLGGQFIITFLEIFLAVHFEGNFADLVNLYQVGNLVRFIPAGTFDNPNNLALYLNISVVFLLVLLKLKPKRTDIWLLLLSLSVVVIFHCYSRFAVINLAITALAFPALYNYPGYYKKLFLNDKVFRSVAFGILVSISLILYNGMVNEKPSKNIISHPDSSISVRKNLILNGLAFFQDSKWLGVGAGNYEALLLADKGKYDTEHIINSHNWFIQILAQYGIFITIAFVIGLVVTAYSLLRKVMEINHYNEKNRLMAISILILMILYPSISSMPSNFLQNPFNWLMLFSFAFAADKISEKNQHETIGN